VVLCTVAFTFLAHTDVLSIAIGCLQGGRAAETKENIRFATRDLFGLRPKTMLVRLVQQLGLQLGCRDVQLVSNANRVVQRQLRKKLVFADYDITWQELGAIQYAHGDYVLPCVELAPPDLTAIASSKRSEAKKRFALLSEIVTSVTEAIDVEQRSDAVITETWLDVPSRGAWRRKLYPHVRQCVGFVFQNAAMIAGIQCYLILSPLA